MARKIGENEMYNTYLMWVGSESYPTMEDWMKEAEEQGVSKRLPNVNVGQSMENSDSVVFVAHDEGNWRNCSDCIGMIENPNWRLLTVKIRKLMGEISKLEAEEREIYNYWGSRFDSPDWDAITKAKADEDRKKAERISRKVLVRENKISQLKKERTTISNFIEAGSGGKVEVKNLIESRLETIDYRKYNYWHRQPKVFSEKWEVVEEDMCKTCGGKGQLPLGKIYGLFIPTAVEYILKEEDDGKVKEMMRKRGFELITTEMLKAEQKRKCGHRKAGGVYVVAKDFEKKAIVGKISELVKSKVFRHSYEIKGSFIRFLSPVDIDSKRFRGIKRWSVENGEIEEETDMVMDALE